MFSTVRRSLLRRHGFARTAPGRSRRGLRELVVPTLVTTALVVPAAVAVTTSQAVAEPGAWGPVLDWGLQGKHMAALPTGKVLVWSTGVNARVWDPSNGTFTDAPALFGDLHCAGNAQLADGRVVVLGGQNGATHVGTKVTALLDPNTQTWTAGAPMTYERWYASVTPLPDGRVLSTSGDDAQGRRVPTPEVYDPATDTWSLLTGAARSQGLYPHMYVLPNGKVYEAAPGSSTALLDLAGTGSWSSGPTNGWSTSGYSESSVMYEPGKIMRAGGGDPAIARTAVVDMTAASPAWQETAPMAFARRRMNMVILADGQVLAIGGTTSGDDASKAVLAAELWNPQTRTWSTLGSMAEARMYHSSAVLMLDGRVVVAGGEAGGRLRAQVFTPPYLLTGAARPTITAAPATTGYGSSFAVSAPNASSISSVALIRLGAATHAWDQNQRYVPLQFAATPTGVLATAPAGGTIAPPGTYMLVVKDAAGVPSVGRSIRIGSAASLAPGRILGRVTAAGSPVVGATVTAGGVTTSTNTTGTYTLGGLTPGEQGVTVTASGLATAVLAVIVPAGGDASADFALVPPGNVSGRVTDAGTGAPIGDAVLTYPGGSATTDPAGSYTITGAPSGPLQIIASANGYDSRTLNVTVPAGGTLTFDVALTRSPTFITGAVLVRATGAPVPGATVTLQGGATTTTDGIGRYRFDVAPGTYTVSGTAPGYTTATGTAIVTAGTFAAVELQLDPVGASNRLKDITFENGSLTHPTSGADSTSGSVTLDPASPLAGTASARFAGTSTGYVQEGFGSQDDLYAAALLRVNILPGTDTRVVQVLGGSTTFGALQLRPSGRLRLRNGSTTIGAESAVLTPGTTYRIGVHQRRGTGGDAVLEAFVAPAGQGFGAPFAATTTGAWTTPASAVRAGVTTGNAGIGLDDVLLDAASMPGGGGTPPPPPGPSLTFTPTADAQTKSTSATTNYGTASTLRLRRGTVSSPGDYRTYLRFAVAGLAPTVTAAKLRLYVTDASTVGGSVFRTAGAWTESGVTWNSQPAVTGSALSTKGATTSGTWVEFDVTPAVTGNGTVELGLTTTSTDSAIYSSREGANPPQLVVTSS